MSMVEVQFRYLTGLRRQMFRNARLCGTWDGTGRLSPNWSETPMQACVAEDGCPAFLAKVQLDEADTGKRFRWGVRLDTPAAANLWGIPTETADANSVDRVREFILAPVGGKQSEDFYFTYVRRFGARKVHKNMQSKPDLRFAVWAPDALKVEVVFGKPDSGYIADDGFGIDLTRPTLPMSKGPEGVWQTAILPDFASWEFAPYMYRLTNAQGRVVYRTDLYSRQQIGRGHTDPNGGHWAGTPEELEGSKSCSLVVTMETVARDISNPAGHQVPRVSEEAFWAYEFTPGLPVPSRVEDMVIYELHIGGLGFGKPGPGNLEDALAFLPHLTDLGVNAVELLPTSEYSGIGWGYGDSHHFVVESTAGNRDQYKHFVRECHRRGIAVIQDVVFNHFDGNADRAQWAYDSDAPNQNQYYWYEGQPSDYPSSDGGYLDNGSSGYTPRFWEEKVRHLFVSSAAALVEDCHVDGFRVDLTQAIHRDNRLHANGWTIDSANQFGAKLLREWSRTLRMIKPTAMLIAEDHSEWDKVAQLPEEGGLGFDATWYAAFYHNLVGDSDMAGGRARLLKFAGLADNRPLDLNQFAGVLYPTKLNKVVYHESHDEAGNAGGTMRTLPCAVNDAPLVGATRTYAEARARVVFGLSLFSAGTPMFFMGEEVGAQKRYKYDNFLNAREDILAERAGEGGPLFRFYQDAIRFSRRHSAVRARTIDIVHVNPSARLLAFRRSSGVDELLIVASLNDSSFDTYILQTDFGRVPDGLWREVFNSNAATYGGDGSGNLGAQLPASAGRFELRVPANTLLIFAKV